MKIPDCEPAEDKFNLIEYERSNAFGGGTHIKIHGRQQPDGTYEVEVFPMSMRARGEGQEPTTRFVPKEKLDRLLELLENARISVPPPFISGHDGTQVTLRIIAGRNQIHLLWWLGLPAGWSELEGVLNAISMLQHE